GCGPGGPRPGRGVRRAALLSRALGVWSMSPRTPSSGNRACRPSADRLEGRHLLSATVTGPDPAGDTWTLRLIGPGSLLVTKQNDSSGNPAPLNSPPDINTITLRGAD